MSKLQDLARMRNWQRRMIRGIFANLLRIGRNLDMAPSVALGLKTLEQYFLYPLDAKWKADVAKLQSPIESDNVST